MEKSFDFGALLKNHEKKHKSKPTQFVSVAGGVKKRLENNLKYRKSSRLTVFDSIRNLQRCESLASMSDAQQKVEHRRQQLEKWKEEKEKRKKEAAAQKKKPFIAGVPHAPLKFILPPPALKPVPSTSGRVTRSQSAKNSKQNIQVIDTNATHSFAPKNASFRPPQNLAKALKLLPTKSKKRYNSNLTVFEPIVMSNLNKNTKDSAKETRRKSTNQFLAVTERVTRSYQINTRNVNGKVIENVQRPKQASSLSSSTSDEIEPPTIPKNVLYTYPSSSSSEIEQQLQIHTSDSSQRTSSSEIETLVQSPTMQLKKNKNTRKSLLASNTPKKAKTPRKSIGTLKECTPKRTVPKSESSSEEKLRSPKAADELLTPEQIVEGAKNSPYVTISRGKDNARREMKKKIEDGLLDEDASDLDSVEHFRKQLASETKRMTEMCDTWDKISEQTQLPESVQECVLSAVGQARLLMSQKLAQFATLVERCARALLPPSPTTTTTTIGALVTPADLHGFWDMVFMQVVNVEMRFKKLEELRARGWVDDQPAGAGAGAGAEAEVQRRVVKNVTKKTAKPTAGPSRLREMIAAARKAKKEQVAPSPAPEGGEVAERDDKTFEAGFFCVRSPVRSPAVTGTPGRPSLLKAVLSNEANKSASKSSASFAMLRASLLGKHMECDGVALLPQTPINLQATPGRSILKSANIVNEKSGKKSIKMVLFDQTEDNELNLSNEINTNNSKGSKMDASINNDSGNKTTEDILEKELNADSGLSSMDLEKDGEMDKENSKRKSKLMRQDATEFSPVMTRSRRKSMNTPQVEPMENENKSRRSSNKKKALHDLEGNAPEMTPKSSSRRRKSGLQGVVV